MTQLTYREDVCSCITKQSGISLEQLKQAVAYGNEHNLGDLITVCSYFKLNCIVQTDTNSARMIRYGNMDAPYMLIAHSTALIDSERGTGHWFVPHGATLRGMPRGLWDNQDYSLYDVARYLNRDVFYMTRDEWSSMNTELREDIQRQSLRTTWLPRMPSVVLEGGVNYLSNSS